MGGFQVIAALFFLVLFVLPAIKKGLERMAEQQRQQGGGAEDDVTYKAPPEEIQEFLQSLAEARGARQQAPPRQAPVQAPPPQRAAPAPRPTPPMGRLVSVSPPLTVGRGAGDIRPARPAKRAARAVTPRGKPIVAPKPAAPPAQPARKGIDVAVLLSGTKTLKQAVVWSEILGRPVSLRKSRRHAPPTGER